MDKDNLPKELNCFNWGAFLLNWIWGIMHKKYITLLYFPACIIPLLGPLLVSIWFGNVGNKWAWESQNWESVEQFNEVQQKYVRLWIVLFIFSVVICVKLFFIFAYIGMHTGA
jgi:hypothetical protein